MKESKNIQPFNVPGKSEVSLKDQAIFDTLEQQIGFVPNILAALSHSDHALSTYLHLQESHKKGALEALEREAVNLVVSEVNESLYCQSAHTYSSRMNCFSDREILLLRSGNSNIPKLDALVKLAKSVAENKGKPTSKALRHFYAAGYTHKHLVDVIMIIGEKTITNFLYAATQVPIDFPQAEELEATAPEADYIWR